MKRNCIVLCLYYILSITTGSARDLNDIHITHHLRIVMPENKTVVMQELDALVDHAKSVHNDSHCVCEVQLIDSQVSPHLYNFLVVPVKDFLNKNHLPDLVDFYIYFGPQWYNFAFTDRPVGYAKHRIVLGYDYVSLMMLEPFVEGLSFVIGHELGHCLIHPYYKHPRIMEESERLADQFALRAIEDERCALYNFIFWNIALAYLKRENLTEYMPMNKKERRLFIQRLAIRIYDFFHAHGEDLFIHLFPEKLMLYDVVSDSIDKAREYPWFKRILYGKDTLSHYEKRISNFFLQHCFNQRLLTNDNVEYNHTCDDNVEYNHTFLDRYHAAVSFFKH